MELRILNNAISGQKAWVWMLPLLLCSTLSWGSSWQTCLAGLKDQALEQGVSEATLESVFADIEQLPRVIKSDRNQPEFSKTFTEYYQRRVTDFRVQQGRNLLAQHGPLLARIQDESGVPPQYLVALWGLETNFGSYFGKLPIPSALATLACDTRRPDFFARELFATLAIIDAGDLAASSLIGSWAGAIGHMQFMPTTYQRHAVDGDGDGKKDLLGSIEDALSSGAAYLADLGWEQGYRWGREILLPNGFDYVQSGSDNWKPLSSWVEMGVTDVFGNALGPIDMQSAIILPTGHTGPVFLVYPNFRIIMRWNRSEAYAVSVGRLADRISGAGRLTTALPKVEASRLSIQQMVSLQSHLNTLGYDVGKADGILGPATRRAVRTFQNEAGMIADGYPTKDVFSAAGKKADLLASSQATDTTTD